MHDTQVPITVCHKLVMLSNFSHAVLCHVASGMRDGDPVGIHAIPKQASVT